MNLILHDNNGVYENNNGMDFTYPVDAGITYDIWIDTAAERAVARELARQVRQFVMTTADRDFVCLRAEPVLVESGN